MTRPTEPVNGKTPDRFHFRFHLPTLPLQSVFGDDWFALKAEAFARFFGTPVFLVIQTVVVAVWIGLNVMGLTKFDVYPFILLNLAFSLQAAYAAPLILLAQTRQADRDKANSMADAQHREELHKISDARQAEMERIMGFVPAKGFTSHVYRTAAEILGQGVQTRIFRQLIGQMGDYLEYMLATGRQPAAPHHKQVS